MRKSKITPDIKKVILKEAGKNPLLGCRKLSALLYSKYKIRFSKSAVNHLLVSSGKGRRPGRKEEIIPFKSKLLDNAGLVFVKKAFYDSGIGRIISDYISVYKDVFSFKKALSLYELCIYAAFLREEPEDIFRNDVVFKLLGLKQNLSLKEIKRFKQGGKERSGVFFRDNSFLNKGLQQVSALEMVFHQGKASVFLDPQLKSVWSFSEDIPSVFSLSLSRARENLNWCMRKNLWVIEGFSYFSGFPPAMRRLFRAFPWRVSCIKVWGQKKELLDTIEVKLLKEFKFIIGFIPQASFFSQGKILHRTKACQYSLPYLYADVYADRIKTKYSELIGEEGVIINNVLLRKRQRSRPFFGFLTNLEETSLKKVLFSYLLSWPYLNKGFSRFLETVRTASFSDKKLDIRRFLPDFNEFAGEKRDVEFFTELLKKHLFYSFSFSEYPFPDEFLDILIHLKGRFFKETKDSVRIVLNLPADFPHKARISNLSASFNEGMASSGMKRYFLVMGSGLKI